MRFLGLGRGAGIDVAAVDMMPPLRHEYTNHDYTTHMSLCVRKILILHEYEYTNHDYTTHNHYLDN